MKSLRTKKINNETLRTLQPLSNYTFFVLETKRLWLRLITPKDYEYIYAHLNDTQLKELLGFNTQHELELHRAKFEKGLHHYRFHMAYFQILLKPDARVIGSAGFHTWNVEHHKAELGYDIRYDELKRQGFMTEAIDALLLYGFQSLKLKRIEACIGPENLASQGVVNHFKFTKEGVLRSHYLKDGIYHDSLIFSLLREEYFTT